MTTNTNNTTTTTTNTTATATATNTTNSTTAIATTTCTDRKTDTLTANLKTNSHNSNNSHTNNIDQNDKTSNELLSKEVSDFELKASEENVPSVATDLNAVEVKNQSLTKINSSIAHNDFNDNNNLVSLGLDLDLDKLTNNISSHYAAVEGKAINFDDNTNPNKSNEIKENELGSKAVKTQEPPQLDRSLIKTSLDSESYKLLQKLPINNPFYRFHKQSNSFREIRNEKKTSFDFLTHTRKFKSDTDLCYSHEMTTANVTALINTSNFCHKNNIVVVANHCEKNRTITRNQKIDIKFNHQQWNKLQNHQPNNNSSNNGNSNSNTFSSPTVSQSGTAVMPMKPNDFNNSTVITNPFSIFHDDETHLTLSVDNRLRCASSASRRMLRKPPTGNISSSASSTGSATLQTSKAFASQQQLYSYHYLYGVPIKKFERQDFPTATENIGRSKKTKLPTSSSSTSVFKQISLRKLPKTASASSSNIHVPLTGPQLKRLKITYPNHTQPLVAISSNTPSNKHSYLSRLQAKTRQGLQKLKDKCKQFNNATAYRSHLGRHQHTSAFKSMSKVESFRFISDRDNIRNYETRCMAAYHQDHKQKQGILYKSYKSELDLSKNLNYLEAYLNQNFEQANSAQSVGRAQGQKIRRAFHQVNESTNKHKRDNSHSSVELGVSPTKFNFRKNNYENVQNVPLTKSESLSSSDYASVFSANCGEDVLSQPECEKTDLSYHSNLRYEHPKMSEFTYDSKNLKLRLHKPQEFKYEEQQQLQQQQQQEPILEEEKEVEETELAFKQELLKICHKKERRHFQDMPLDLPKDEDDELASNNIRILINNSEDFERSPEDDWYMQRTENDSLTELAFYQSLNEQLQQEQIYEANARLSYDPFMRHINTDLYPLNSETEDEKQLISSSSSLQHNSDLGNSLKYNYQDYKAAAENAQLMQSLYKTYRNQTQTKSSTLSNSSSSNSSLYQQQQQQHQSTTQTSTNNYKPINPSSLKNNTTATTTTPNPSSNTQVHYLPSRRTSNSSADIFDNFATTRSYQHKIPSKRSSFSQYQQRSPIQPQMNALNYYGVSSSNDTYSIPFKLQSSSSSSNHSSKLSNSSSNSTTSSSHNHALNLPAFHLGSSLPTAAATNSPATQINLTKLYNNQNASSSSNTSSSTLITNIATRPASSQSLLYAQEKRDKFILEYEC